LLCDSVCPFAKVTYLSDSIIDRLNPAGSIPRLRGQRLDNTLTPVLFIIEKAFHGKISKETLLNSHEPLFTSIIV
jgi:hypothetical protein